jgi:hypothetical protein
MRGYWIRLTNGLIERWTPWPGEDGVSAHMGAANWFEGTEWRVCWP